MNQEFLNKIRNIDPSIVRVELLTLANNLKNYLETNITDHNLYIFILCVKKYIAERNWRKLCIAYALHKDRNQEVITRALDRLDTLIRVHDNLIYENYISSISSIDFKCFQKNNNLRLYLGLLRIGNDLNIKKILNYL